MYIKELTATNYRALPAETIKFTSSTNFIVGENNTGKSSVLDCLELLFTRSAIPAEDFRDENLPITVVVKIHFEEEEVGLCGEYCDSANHDELTVRFYCETPNDEIEAYLDESGEPLSLREVRKVKFFKYASAVSGSHNLNFDKGRGVGKVLTRAFLNYQEKSGKSTADLIDEGQMKELIEYLNETFGSLPILSDYGMHVSLDTTDKSALGSVVTLADGNNLHFQKVGSGVQYVALLMLSVVESIMRMSDRQREFCIVENEDGSKQFKCVISFDEPEAHLHPYMQRRLIKEIERIADGENNQFNVLLKEFFEIDIFSAQVLIVTHSPNVLQGGYKNVIHLSDDGINPVSVTNGVDVTLSPSAAKILATHFELIREALFVKNVLVVEGITEQVALPGFASKLGIDVDEHGVLVLQADSKSSINSVQELLDAFCIRNISIADRDKNEEVANGRNRTTHFYDFEEEVVEALFKGGKQEVLKDLVKNMSSSGLKTKIPESAYQKHACRKLGFAECLDEIWLNDSCFDGPNFSKTDKTKGALYTWLSMQKGAQLGGWIGRYIPKECIPECYVEVLKYAAGMGDESA